MKIKLKIQQYTLECICRVYDASDLYYESYPSEIHFTKEFRAVKNLIDILLLKLKKKALEPPKKGKYLTLNLEYNQAYFLMNFLQANTTFIFGALEKSLLQQLIENIRQEL